MSFRGAAFVLLVTLAAIGCVVAFSPAVSTYDIQRRDRLSDEGRFVDATYRHFLGRPADGAGLSDYQSLYEREGPRAVARAIVASSEYAQRHPEVTDPSTQADTFVAAYQSGALAPPGPPDWPGRLGFVVLLALSASALVVLQRLSRRPLSGTELHTYVPHWLLVGLFSALSVTWFLNTQALFYAFTPGAIGYAEWLDRVASLLQERGLTQVWTPYPQATPVLLVALETVARAVAGWLRSDVWTSYTVFRWLFQAVFLLLPSLVLVSTTYRLGMQISPASATVAAAIVAFSFAPLYYGVTSTVVTDPLPVCLTFLALWLLLRRQPLWAGLALGLAAAMKLIPLVLVVPFVVLATSWRARWTTALAPLLVVACVFVPFALSDSEIFLSPWRWQSGRPPWESLFAFGNWLIGARHEYLQPAFEDLGVGHNFGWVFWGITPPLTALTSPVPAMPTHWENIVGGLGGVICLLAVLGARSSTPRALVRWCLYALAVTFFWSPGWSPQYELYLIPLVALAFESPLAALGSAVMLELPTFLEYPLLLPWAYFYGGSAVWLAWSATLARYLVLGWLALYVLRTEVSLPALRHRLRPLRPIARTAVAGALALGIFFVPNAASAQPTSGCGPVRATGLQPTALGDLDWPLPGGWFFTEAGDPATTNSGFSVTDDSAARMWTEFHRLGGWPVLGFPASQRFVWHGRLSQATQRAVLQ